MGPGQLLSLLFFLLGARMQQTVAYRLHNLVCATTKQNKTICNQCTIFKKSANLKLSAYGHIFVPVYQSKVGTECLHQL